MSIDPKGLRGFRPDRRRFNDPDETEGRALYRAIADAEARRSIAMTRKVRLKPVEPAGRAALSTPLGIIAIPAVTDEKEK